MRGGKNNWFFKILDEASRTFKRKIALMSYFFGRLESNMWCERMRRGFLIIWFYVIYSLICRLKSDEERSKGSSSSTAGDREKDRDGRDRERERSRDGDDRWACATVLRYSLPMPCLKSPLSILRSFYCQSFRLLSIEWIKYIYNDIRCKDRQLLHEIVDLLHPLNRK